LASTELGHIRSIGDPRERARLAHALIGELQAESAEASRIRREAVTDLIIRQGATRIEVADLLGVSRERIRQILTEGPPPEQALLAPDPGPVTICVIEKGRDSRGNPVVADTTITAVDKLRNLATSYDLEVARETTPASGLIDLNRPNLVVLIGPRSSMLIAQAVSADPVIKWRPDKNDDWYITDARTGSEYHSDFDSSADPGTGWPRTCYAHVGRVRRPDSQGSWLCLAGEHAPGVAGAAELFCRDIAALWEQVRRNLWSAVVQVTVGEGGRIEAASLVTPVYVHGRG
jgi:hypothetical protein